MISVPNDLKVNKYKFVEIPSPNKVFMRTGYMLTPNNNYSGDNTAVLMQTKLESIAHADSVDRSMLKQEIAKRENQPDSND